MESSSCPPGRPSRLSLEGKALGLYLDGASIGVSITSSFVCEPGCGAVPVPGSKPLGAFQCNSLLVDVATMLSTAGMGLSSMAKVSLDWLPRGGTTAAKTALTTLALWRPAHGGSSFGRARVPLIHHTMPGDQLQRLSFQDHARLIADATLRGNRLLKQTSRL